MRHVDAMNDLSQTSIASSNPSGSETRRTRTDSTCRRTVLTGTAGFIASTARQGWGEFLNSLTIQRVQRLRPAQILMRIAILGLTVIVASGIGHSLFHPVRDDSREAAQVVTSLVDGSATLASVPANFKEEIGYQPVAAAGALVNPSGGCSTPGGIGPESFDTACRVHDFGYDMLRYAEGTSPRLGAWARFDLDQHLYADLLQTCDTVTCRGTATVYYTAVTVNSIRQGYVAPTTEPAIPWVVVAVVVVGLAMVTAPAKGDKRDEQTDREHEHHTSQPRPRCNPEGGRHRRHRRHRRPIRRSPRPGHCCSRCLFGHPSDHFVLVGRHGDRRFGGFGGLPHRVERRALPNSASSHGRRGVRPECVRIETQALDASIQAHDRRIGEISIREWNSLGQGGPSAVRRRPLDNARRRAPINAKRLVIEHV